IFQVTQQTKVVQPTATVSVALNNKVGHVSGPVQTTNTTPSTGHVVKVNGQQVLLKHNAANDNKQVVTVGASEAAVGTVPGSNSVSAGSGPRQVVVAPASGQTSPRIKTMLAPDGTCVKTVLPNAAAPASAPPASTQTNTATTALSPTSPVSQFVPPGSSLTLRVQVRMTEQGPKTIIQGLQPGVGLTKDHIMAIQQQVRNMLQQYNLQVNQLSPVMALTLHVPSKSPTTAAPTTAQQQQKQQQQQPQIASTATHQTVTVNQQQTTGTEIFRVFGNMSPVAEDKASPATGASPQKFVLTPEYIQQTIKSALSKEDLAPEIEEKLMQLQKYNSEHTKPDEIIRKISSSSSNNNNNNNSNSNNNKRQRDSEPDHDWDPIEEKARPRPKKSRPKPRSTESSKSKKQSSVAKAEAVDARRKKALQNRLEAFHCRHKDLLKKDILKKRAQLEKELQVQIHKELSVARFQLQMLEKNKPETAHSASLSSPRKKKTVTSISIYHEPSNTGLKWPPQSAAVTTLTTTSQEPIQAPPTISASPITEQLAQPTSSSKKPPKKSTKKIVCICRTVFDDSKFYVGCDLCGNWFHGDCVGITETMSRSMTEYVCDDCANAKLNKELFCFCRQ
ncbi:unnamed protein product, partial [Meganyctiphanes norvegica]